MSQTLKV